MVASDPERDGPFVASHVMVVVAHPDDETLSAGASLSAARRLTYVHVTDGAESFFSARRKGFNSRQAYARARAAEVREAVSRLNADKEFVSFNVRDQQAAFHIIEIANSIAELLQSKRPDVILTHAFEGGHPDHDSTAMAVQIAVAAQGKKVAVFELSGYHNAEGRTSFGSFINWAGANVTTVCLTNAEMELKKQMRLSFATQQAFIEQYPVDVERFRLAPAYNFTKRPHPGPLHYEVGWLPMTWWLWRILATFSLRHTPKEIAQWRVVGELTRMALLTWKVATFYRRPLKASRITRS